MAPFEIRAATPADVAAILQICNDVFATSTAVSTSAPATLTERTAWFEARTGAWRGH
jgi:L-amino acid N-acyltransferase YncA